MSFNTLRSILKVVKQFSFSSWLLKPLWMAFFSWSHCCFFITLPSEEWVQYQFLSAILSNLCICLLQHTGCSFSATSLLCLEKGHQQMAEGDFCQWLSDILLRITHFSAAGSCDNQLLLPAVSGRPPENHWLGCCGELSSWAGAFSNADISGTSESHKKSFDLCFFNSLRFVSRSP